MLIVFIGTPKFNYTTVLHNNMLKVNIGFTLFPVCNEINLTPPLFFSVFGFSGIRGYHQRRCIDGLKIAAL